MFRIIFYKITLVILAISLVSCNFEKNKSMVDQVLVEAKQHFAPDKRTVVFDVDGKIDGRSVVLSGEIQSQILRERLVDFVRERTGLEVVNKIVALPDTSLGERIYGIVSVSVGNVRSKPGHSAELATQVLLGSPLRILKKEKSWYYVQTPNDYLGWMTDGFELMDGREFDAWATHPKIIVTEDYAFSYREPTRKAERVGDIVSGDLLLLKGEVGGSYKVSYPDGRTAFVAKEFAVPFDRWIAQAKDTPDNIVTTAKRFTGIPYLWGGTSAKGFDCSGFTHTVFYLNGVLLPRDASQQVLVGEPIDAGEKFENLLVGDLIFFGSKSTSEKKERVTHVGISLGGGKFIHASGDVRFNSLNPADSDYNTNRHNSYLHSRRIIGKGVEYGIQRLSSIPFYVAGSKPM